MNYEEKFTPVSHESLDGVNRPVWSRYVEEFVSSDTWTDHGERDLLRLLAPRIRGKRMLDVGVGAGRTAWILPLMTDQYVAIDYTPEMVEAAKRIHPERDIRVGDARDLGDFADGAFDFLMFSYNGLDALEHQDRQSALDEFHRVLSPDGILMFSTLDKTGRNYLLPPWNRIDRSGRRNPVIRAARFAAYAPRNLSRYRREYANWKRLLRLSQDHGDWAIGPLAAQEFGLLVHFITPDGQRRELEEHGFAVETMVDDAGSPVQTTSQQSNRSFFHVVAVKK